MYVIVSFNPLSHVGFIAYEPSGAIEYVVAALKVARAEQPLATNEVEKRVPRRPILAQ